MHRVVQDHWMCVKRLQLSYISYRSRLRLAVLLGVGTLIAEMILAVRTWVIWHRNRRIGIVLCVALVVFWVPVFYVLQVALYSLVCECL